MHTMAKSRTRSPSGGSGRKGSEHEDGGLPRWKRLLACLDSEPNAYEALAGPLGYESWRELYWDVKYIRDQGSGILVWVMVDSGRYDRWRYVWVDECCALKVREVLDGADLSSVPEVRTMRPGSSPFRYSAYPAGVISEKLIYASAPRGPGILQRTEAPKKMVKWSDWKGLVCCLSTIPGRRENIEAELGWDARQLRHAVQAAREHGRYNVIRRVICSGERKEKDLLLLLDRRGTERVAAELSEEYELWEKTTDRETGLSMSDVKVALGRSEAGVRRMVEKGELWAVRIDKKLRFVKDEVLGLVERNAGE